MAFALQYITNDTTDIHGIESQNYDPRLEAAAEASDGLLHIAGRHFHAAAPMLSFRSRDLQSLATLLDGNADAPYIALAGNGLQWYAADMSTTAPGYKAGSEHNKYAATSGALVLDRLSWAHGQHAVCECSAFFLSGDGTTAPVSTSTVSLPTQAAWTSGYRLTSLTVGGSSVTTGFVSLELTVAHGVENNVPDTCRSLGLPYPTQLAMPGAHGQIDMQMIVEVQDLDISPTSGDVSATFTEVDEGGFLDADTVQLSFNGEIEPVLPHGGDHGQPLTTTLRCLGTWDGTNKPLSITA